MNWDWAGHTCRIHSERWPLIVTKGIPQDGRRQAWQAETKIAGRPGCILGGQAEDCYRDVFTQQWDTIAG